MAEIRKADREAAKKLWICRHLFLEASLPESEISEIIARHMEPERAAGQKMRDYLAQYVEKCGASGSIPCHCGEIDPLIAAWDKANGKG